MERQVIVSSENKMVKLIRAINTGKDKGHFIIEGENFVKDIPSHIEVVAYVSAESAKKTSHLPEKTWIISDQLLFPLLKTVNPQGVLAICRRQNLSLADAPTKEAPFVLLLDRIQDPGNMGTLIRTAKAFGVDYIITLKGSVSIYNDKVLRSSAGGILELPIVEGQTPEMTHEHLMARGIVTIATSPQAEKYHDELAYTGGVCVILGNESQGISEKVLSFSEFYVKIAIVAMESLNVSVAGGIMMQQAFKNRNQ